MIKVIFITISTRNENVNLFIIIFSIKKLFKRLNESFEKF